MITIYKGVEPNEWTEKKKTPGFTEYEPIPELRAALLKEQGYICAYCMRRIPTEDINIDATSKIEHLKSREERPDLQNVYSNMAVCCPGNLNNEPHCDKLKGGRSVSFDLRRPVLQRSISYKTATGEINSSNTQWNNEIISFLNLNHKLLKFNRKQVLEGLVEYLKKEEGWNKKGLALQIKLWGEIDNDGKKRPHAGIVIWYLERKLRQLG